MNNPIISQQISSISLGLLHRCTNEACLFSLTTWVIWHVPIKDPVYCLQQFIWCWYCDPSFPPFSLQGACRMMLLMIRDHWSCWNAGLQQLSAWDTWNSSRWSCHCGLRQMTALLKVPCLRMIWASRDPKIFGYPRSPNKWQGRKRVRCRGLSVGSSRNPGRVPSQIRIDLLCVRFNGIHHR